MIHYLDGHMIMGYPLWERQSICPNFKVENYGTQIGPTLGRYDEALDHLERVSENRAESFFEISMETDPFLEPLYDMPRFKKIVADSKKEFKGL